MAPLPAFFQGLSSRFPRPVDADIVSSLSNAGNTILEARKEAYNLAIRSLTERAQIKSHGFATGSGSKPASSFNNQAFLALFATLGAVMVLAGIWFFFFAKNGGFHFEEGDWEDYKSTVLRRKGPDGRTLTNATKSTKLGGSTIAGTQHFKWAKHQAKSVISRDEKGRKGILAKRGWGKTHSITYSDDFTEFGDSRTRSDARTRAGADEMAEVRAMPDEPRHHHKHHRDRDVQDYKKERPARVGGINRVAEGSHVDTTNTDVSDVYSESNSDRPILKKENRDQDRDRAERRARAEAAKMERRWKKEAEEAAAALAQESSRAHREPKKSAAPSKPSVARQRSQSRSASPKKRDFSFQNGPESETLSTSRTGTGSRRTASYFEQYRPQAGHSRGYASDHGNRQSSPSKKAPGRSGGYRRGMDSDLD